MTNFDVLVAGELNADLILNKLEAKPEMGKEVIAREMNLVMGSSSAIFACNLSKMGVLVSFTGKLGNDILGDLVDKSLSEKNVDTRNVLRSNKWQTGISVATVEDNDRVMVTFPGGMEDFSSKDISEEMLSSAKHLHVSSIFLQPSLQNSIIDLFDRAKKAGMTTSLDPQFDPNEEWSLDLENLLPLTDVFMPNRSEFIGLCGEQDLQKAMKRIAPFSNHLVVKDSTNGAFMLCDNKVIHQPAYLNDSVVDIIGAGDSFDAGFIAKFIQGETPEKCLDFAMLMGAINTTGIGGTGAFDQDFESIRNIIKKRWQKEI